MPANPATITAYLSLACTPQYRAIKGWEADIEGMGVVKIGEIVEDELAARRLKVERYLRRNGARKLGKRSKRSSADRKAELLAKIMR